MVWYLIVWYSKVRLCKEDKERHRKEMGGRVSNGKVRYIRYGIVT